MRAGLWPFPGQRSKAVITARYPVKQSRPVNQLTSSLIHRFTDSLVQLFPQQCLYFFPLLHGQGSLRPTLGPARTGRAFSTAAAASLTMSLPLGGPLPAAGVAVAASAPVVEPPKALVD